MTERTRPNVPAGPASRRAVPERAGVLTPRLVPFTFRYDRFGNLAIVVVLTVVFAAREGIRTEGGVTTFVVLFVAGWLVQNLVLYFGIVWAIPAMPDRKKVTVDLDGLSVGRLHLPAERIAEIAVIDGQTATSQLFTFRSLWTNDFAIDGRRIRWNRFVYSWSTRTAVLVRDRDGDHKPWWLLTTPEDLDVTRFVRALQQIAPDLTPGEPTRPHPATAERDLTSVVPWIRAVNEHPPHDRPVRTLADLPVEGEDLTPERLEEVAREGAISLGAFTDEELYWLEHRDDALDIELDSPRLATLSADAQRAALDATLVLLLARGDLIADEQEDPEAAEEVVRATGPHDLIARFRFTPLGMARLRTEDREGAVKMSAAYHVTDGLTLLEDVDPAGVHAFWLAADDFSTAWLARQLDPLGRAARRSPPIIAPSVDALGEGPRAKVATAHLSTEVDLARAWGDRPEVWAYTVWTLPDELAVVNFTGRDEGEASYRQLDPAGVHELAATCLAEIAPRAADGATGGGAQP